MIGERTSCAVVSSPGPPGHGRRGRHHRPATQAHRRLGRRPHRELLLLPSGGVAAAVEAEAAALLDGQGVAGAVDRRAARVLGEPGSAEADGDAVAPECPFAVAVLIRLGPPDRGEEQLEAPPGPVDAGGQVPRGTGTTALADTDDSIRMSRPAWEKNPAARRCTGGRRPEPAPRQRPLAGRPSTSRQVTHYASSAANNILFRARNAGSTSHIARRPAFLVFADLAS